MRIGIDCDGVLRDLITCITDTVKETHPQHADKILEPTSWDWEQWLPFWTEAETEKYVFEDNYLDFFGPVANPIKSSHEDWIKIRRWAEDKGHELILVSAQRENCKELTDEWLKMWGFDFKEKHYTHHKWAVDVDYLIDDSPEKLEQFANESVNGGEAICMRQTWNTKCHNKYKTIDRLSDITKLV